MYVRSIFEKREYWLEEIYFRKRDQELVEKLHRLRARQTEHRRMADIAGISDQDVIDALQELGYTSKTVQLLYFAPLVQIAWSEGGVADRERGMILNLASTRGVEPGSVAQQELIQWLTVKPSEKFFEGNLHAIRVIFASLPPEQRESRRQQLLESCRLIASTVEGGIMGRAQISDAEHRLIDHIRKKIDS